MIVTLPSSKMKSMPSWRDAMAARDPPAASIRERCQSDLNGAAKALYKLETSEPGR